MLTFDPILDIAAIAAVIVLARRKVSALVIPAPVVNVSVEPAQTPAVKVLVPHDISRVAQDQHRADVMQKQPDGSWHVVGHADFEERGILTDRIKLELATEGRGIRWPGSIDVQETAE